MVFHAVLGGERPPDQCNQCCSAVGYGQRIGQQCFSPWVGGLLSGLFFIPSGWRVSYFTASGTLSVGIIWIVLYVCVVLLPSGNCCLPVSLLDSRCLSFLPCNFYSAGPGEDLRKRADRSVLLTPYNSFGLFLMVFFPYVPQMWTVMILWNKCIVLAVGSGHLFWKLFNPFPSMHLKMGLLYDGGEATSPLDKMDMGSRLPASLQSSGMQLRFLGEAAKGNKLDELSCHTAYGLWVISCSS